MRAATRLSVSSSGRQRPWIPCSSPISPWRRPSPRTSQPETAFTSLFSTSSSKLESMDPADFLAVADRLRSSPSEAERRTSVGRAYYALYNLLVMRLSSQGFSFQKDGGDHGRLV